MFQKDEYIIYGTTGVCKVLDVTPVDMDGAAKDSLFYILQPYLNKTSRIFVAVDNQKTIMRRILSKEEVNELITEITEIEELWIESDKMREQCYKDCIRSCDSREWIRIIKTLYRRRQQRTAKGKKITATDEKYLRLAEDNLYTEFSIPLQIPKDEMEAYITEQIEGFEEAETADVDSADVEVQN